MDILNSIDTNEKAYDAVLHNLLSANDDLPVELDQVNNFENTTASHINSQLNQSSTRYNGLDTLSKFLAKAPRDLLSKYASLWIAKASQMLENSGNSIAEITLACKTLGALITKCKDIPELQKSISMQTVKQLITAMSVLRPELKCAATFYLLATILYHYREPSERLQTTIKRMILPLVDAEDKNLVRAGANCYTLLTQVTERSFKSPVDRPNCTAWVHGQALIVNSLHEIMDQLFVGLIELDNSEAGEKLELPNIPQDNVIEYYRSLERRFENLCVYLSTILGGCSGKNSVSPNDIMRLLCRGLAVTPLILKHDDTFKQQMLHFILPKLHTSLFIVLSALIGGFKKELVPYARTILQLYQQTLRWTEKVDESKTTIGGGKPFKSVRIAVYQSLTKWLSSLGALSGINMMAADLSPHLLKDITPEKKRVLLTVQKTQHLSKRALKRFKDNQYENSTSLGSAHAAEKNPLANADLCISALIAVENIFFSASVSLKQSFYTAIQNVLVPLLYDYYLGKKQENFYEANSRCRLQLLKALKALQMNPHPLMPPPTQYSIKIFDMALRDPDNEIVYEAKIATAELEKIAHPSAPTLQLPLRNVQEARENGHENNCNMLAEGPAGILENGVARPENAIWENFKVSRNGSDRTHQDQASEEADTTENPPAIIHAEKSDDPPAKKQRKVDSIDSSEQMKTTDENVKVKNPSQDSVDEAARERIPEPTSDSDSKKMEQSPKGSDVDVTSYFTLKEIQGADSDSQKKENGDDSADVSRNKSPARRIGNSNDVSDDEAAILSLFHDQLKD